MGFLDSFFKSEITYNVEIYTCTQTKTNGVLGAKVYTLSKTISQALIWRDSMARSNISEKYKAEVYGTLAIRPQDATASDFSSINKLTIKDQSGNVVGNFSAIFADDVGLQGQVLMIPIKEFVN